MRTKTFDCVKMKDEAQERRALALQGLSDEERLRYYERAHDELLQRQTKLRGRGPGKGTGVQESAGEDDARHVLDEIAKLAAPSDLPPDYSQQYDHYLKGTPRK